MATNDASATRGRTGAQWRVRTTRITVALAALVVLALLAWEMVATVRDRRHEVEEWRRELTALADSRAVSIGDWAAEQQRKARFVAESAETEAFLRGARSTAQALADFNAERDHFGFASLALFDDALGLRLAQPVTGVDFRDPALAAIIARSAEKGPALFIRQTEDGARRLYIVERVPASGERLGTLVATLDPALRLYRMMRGGDESSMPGSKEALLVARSGKTVEYVSPLKFHALPLSLPLTAPGEQALAANLAWSAEPAFGAGVDYRGVPVFAATHRIADTPFALVVKVDQDEALASWRDSSAERAARSTALLLTLFGLGWLVFHQRHLRDMQQTAQRDARYRLLLERAHDAVLVARASDGRIVEANHAAERQYGYTSSELRHLTLLDLRSGTSQTEIRNLLRERADSDAPYETRHRRKDGSDFPIEVSGGLLDGPEPLVLAIVRDISARKTAELSLVESEKRYRRLFEESPVPMWIFDRRTLAFLAVNDAAVAHYGYSRERFLSMSILDIRPAEEREARRAEAGRPDPPSRQGPFHHLRADGSQIEVFVNVHDVEFAGRPGRMVSIEDLTERLRIERALSENEQLFRSAFEDADVGMAIVATDRTVLRANQAICRILGYAEENLRGKDFVALTHPGDVPSLLRRVGSMLAGQEIAPRLQRRLLHADGSTVWVELSARLLRDAGGKPLYFLAVIQDITARLQADRALQESEERFRSAFDDATIGMVMSAPDGTLQRVNATLGEMLGRPASSLVGVNFTTFVHPEDIQPMLERVTSAMGGETVTSRSHRRLLHADGHIVWVDVTSRLLHDAAGRPLYFLVTVQDVSARLEAEQALLKSRAELQVAIESTHIGLWDWDVTTNEVEYSHEWKAMLGYGDDEVGATLADFERLTLPGDTRPNAAAIAAYIERPIGYHTSEFRMRHKDGSVRWILSRAAATDFDAAGHATRLVGCHLDVTERRQAEQALHDALERFQLVSRASQDVVWEWDLAADQMWWSEGLASVFGYARGNVVIPSTWWREHVHPDDLERVSATANAAVSEHRQVWRQSYRFRAASGEYLEIEDRGYLVFGAPGDGEKLLPVRMVGAMTDVTARRRAEREVLRVNAELEQRVRERTAALEAANRELESFSYSVSHDLRAPLRAISGFSKILVDEHGDNLDAEGRRLVGVVRTNTARMGQLIDDLLAFSRVARQELRTAEIDMRALAESAFAEALAAEPAGAHPITFVLGDLPAVEGDASLFRQVWINLLANALKFTAPKAERRIEVDSQIVDGTVRFRVRDNGVGFDMAYADKLFGVFQRLHARDEFEGTGVGLALVLRIMQRHGGRAWGEGTPGAGATFCFELPAHRSPPQA